MDLAEIHMRNSLGLIEVTGFSATLVVLDTIDKAADVQLLQVELNDLYGAQIKITGDADSIKAAIDAAQRWGERFKGKVVSRAIHAPAAGTWPAIESPREFSPLLEADVVYFPRQKNQQENNVSDSAAPFAIGLIETQGFTAVLEALDTAAKAGNVEVVGREKLGGGYVTVILKGDVAAIKAAVEAGRAKVEESGLGKLIAAHVIARPSAAVLSLLPKS